MAARQSKAQKDTVGRVMHEYKHGELESRGNKVKNPKQAVAIALREAGASKYQSKSRNKASLKRSKAKERRGETGQAAKEGRSRRKTASGRTAKKTSGRRKAARSSTRSTGTTRSGRSRSTGGSRKSTRKPRK